MDNFTERMLERTHRRQELLASATLEVPLKVSLPSPVMENLPSVQKSPSPPPQQRMRRNRFAELASRVDMWLEEDTDIKPKLKENDLTAASKSCINQQAVNKSTNVFSLGSVPAEEKLTKCNKIESTFTQQPKPQLNKLQKFHQHQKSPENKLPPQWQSSNSTETTLTVAQRRALFEQNIAAQQQVKKPITTTVVTISLTKTTATKTTNTTATVDVEKGDNEPMLEVTTTPPRPIPCSKTTPPSRRGTRPRESPAAVALEKLSPKSRNAWTPPCIKNVLLKKKLITELDDDQSKMAETETTVTTSSPINIAAISPADHIAMSVGRVRFMSPSSTLYPDLSLIENDNDDGKNKDTITCSLDNQYTGFKRRNNGNSALDTSTTESSDSLYDNTDDEMLGAKRSRCESKLTNDTGAVHNAKHQDDTLTAVTKMESSPVATATTNDTPNSSFSSSMLSDNRADQTCVSFTYYGSEQNLPLECPQLIDENPQGNNKGIEPALVHTISTYRKQQKQLRISDKSSSKQHTEQLEDEDEEEKYSRSALLRQRLKLLDDDDEDIKLQELEMVAERARNLERTVVPEQDRIIEQATQALNICDMYRQKNGLRPVVSSKFSPEHVHAERLLLIAGLRRTDAVREAQRLRVERTLLPGGKYRQLKIQGNGRTLVIESLCVPILSSVVGSSNKGTEHLTRWPGGYRYFVCAIRAVATGHRPPVTSATRPVDAIEESVLRFSTGGNLVTNRGNGGIDLGYIEFITKKQIKISAVGRKCPMPTEAEGAPIMIHGLDDEGWKITIELYGLSPTAATGEHDHHSGSNNSKEHDGHENIKSVLDKFWSTVTTPGKESKKHATTASTCIESPGGPTAVRNTVFRQLGYFVFSDRQVDRQQFTLNKVHQSSTNTSKTTAEETVRVHMCLLEDGEQYIYDNDEDPRNCDNPSLSSNRYANSGCAMVAAKKPLTFPSECKRTEGFLTLFDDHELRATPTFEQTPKWQRHSNIKGNVKDGGTTLWRRLWFRVEIIDDPKQQQEVDDKSCSETKRQQQINKHQKTIVLRYWLYPEHAEQQREPIGSIDLNRCLPSPPPKAENSTVMSEQQQQKPVPAAPALPDLCARPNTLRLLLYSNNTAFDDDYEDVINSVNDPLLLSADTADERREWCDTVNGAVRALSEHRKWIRMAEAARLNEKQEKDNEEHKKRLQNEQRTGLWPPVSGPAGKSCGKKKKLYK